MMEERKHSSDQEWHSEFHGVKYIVTLTSSDVMLTLEVENADTNERWSGDFTAQYVEETTHKSGSLKKFSVFTKMLASAFSKESENVTVDLLTYTDLELLKANKAGNKQPPKASFAASTSNMKQYQKRYVIITYTSQFDRCHYPLPLNFEDEPNFPALKRTIARLRRQLVDCANAEKEPSSEKEKELRQMVSQLRQDNTELRHRLRHGGNALNNSIVSSNNAAISSHVNVANADMVAANVKLRKQVETLKKELTDSSLAYDRLRTESAREIAKWKLKIGGTTGGDTSLMAGSPSGYSTGGGGGGGTDKKAATVIADLQKKLDAVTKELRFERLSKSQNRNWNQTTNISPARGTSGSWNNNRSSAYSSWSNSADSARRSTSARTSSGTRGWSTTQTGRSTTTGIAGRSVSPVVGPRSSSSATGYRSRESTPPLRTRAPASSPTAAAPYSAGSGAQQRGSPALSSTLGRRFDPTEYQREKALLLQNRRAGRAWGAGATSSPNSTSGRYRYQSPSHGESGYASANSQSSAGSRRSQRSQLSDASSRASSANSKDSRTKKKKSSKKKASKKTSKNHEEDEAPVARPSYSKSSMHTNNEVVSSHLLMGSAERDGSVGRRSMRSTAAPSASKQSPRELPQEAARGAAGSTSFRGAHADPRKSRAVEHRHQHHQQQQHRRSRESPQGDSETDDSDFPEPANSTNRARAATQPVVASPGVATQVNTYLNTGPGLRKSVEGAGEMRRSHEKLVALAQERSSNLIRGDDVHSESDSEMRHSRNLPRRAFERSDMNVRGSFDGSARSEVSKQHNQSHVTSVLSESIASPARRQYRTSETNEMAPRPAPANPVRSSSERPLSAGGAGVSAPSAAAPVIGNQVRRSLRRPSDGSTHSALTSSTAGLPVGGQQGASAAASAVGGSACSSTSSFGNLMAGPHNDITEIDQRIQALQSYLENARSGILASDTL